MIKIMSSIPPNLTDAKQAFPQNFRDETTILQNTLQSLKSATKNNQTFIKDTIKALSEAEGRLFPNQNNRSSYQLELESIFSGNTSHDLQTELNQILPVFNFLDTVFRINSKSTKILNTVESENETEKGTLKSEINKQAQSLMQKTYEVIEKLPTIIKSSVNYRRDSNHSDSITKSILNSTFYQQFIDKKITNLNQKNPDKAKIITKYLDLQNLFSFSPTDSNLKNIFNFRYANMISPSPETVFNSFIESSKKINFDEIRENSRTLTKNLNKNIPEDLKEDLIAAHAQVKAIYELYQQNQDAIHRILERTPHRILEMPDTTLAFMNQALLEKILGRLNLDNHQKSGTSLIESSKSKSLILTSLNLAIDRITNAGKYKKAAKTTDVPHHRRTSGRRCSAPKGSRAS